MKKVSTLALLLFLCSALTSGIAFGQGRNPEFRQEVQAYMQQNVLPVLQAQRLKLEQQLTPQDKQAIQRLRQEMAANRAETKELRASWKQHHSNSTTRTDGEKAQLRAQQEKRKQLYNTTAALAQKYNTQFERLQAEIAADKAKWDTDLQAIWAKHHPVAATEKEGRKRRPAKQLADFRHLMRPTRFILWKVAAPATEGLPATMVYPNPATSTSTISYQLPARGAVKITLLDDKGNVLRTLVEQQQPAGTYTHEMDVRTLPNATYYYRIDTATGSETKRFLKR